MAGVLEPLFSATGCRPLSILQRPLVAETGGAGERRGALRSFLGWGGGASGGDYVSSEKCRIASRAREISG